ncbi:MAG: helix-turn-helix transcriptional regulator [Clostridia bacterium]|nr:helix-turn-helix transcriptional regulator [Clostridia bacterium]MBR2908353.1 helix-turn-helix transcriptional regulator [Clostridia bacterium]
MVNGEKIAALMKKKNITCTRMAEIAGVSVAMITFITQGKREPNIKTLALIAKELGCTVDDLLI